MNASNTRNAIASALKGIATATFADASRELLTALGYRSDRTLDGQTGNVADFITHPNTAIEHTFTQQATFAALIFQVTSNEIGIIDQGQQMLIPAAGFDHQDLAQSFLFMAVDLKDTRYPRSQYISFTREINKRFLAPAVVLFKTADDLLTLAFVHRRMNQRDPKRDVLGSVSLVREINPSNPHRAHLDILQELSLEKCLRWMNANGQPYNFDGLLAAWLDALDTEELNRQFYRDLFAWFSRATREATFPTKEAKTLPPEEHIIRLITRLLFVWFIKEKGLIAEELFVEANVKALLHDYDPVNGDSYYRAILQNLFFATLNTEIHRRGFSKASNATHRDPSRYRYANEIADPDNLLKLFAQTPFINGGLFDCLDSYEASNQGGYRIDCFSDNPNQRKDYSIPNRLFFDDNGLLPLFNRYKFTVEENTPTEQEVALDPELLGKVFENLLAAYNPETASTARKQTGSYYTPRPVVDFMVDEALTAAIAQHCQPMDGDMEFWQARLRELLDYAVAFDDADELFEESERPGIVRAIAHLTVLDPAVGSGAFPMGVLHKLTLALRRLDQDNTRWEQVQKDLALQRADLAFDTQDQQARDAELTNISATFERYRDSDFGRKLYLIQNSIFGVDIQTIATQIAKLRFFISLAIEQEPDPDADNYGIKPLPNLETRFVAANTLLTLAPSPQMSLGHTARVTQLQQELNTNRERYFHATTRHKKLACKEKDKELRDDLAAELDQGGMPTADAEKIAQWDPYDQNASADWFDSAYMFGVKEGFDVVIGNPPYIQLQKNGGRLGKLYKDADYTTFVRTGDIYQLFYERGCQLLAAGGHLCYITSNKWMRSGYGAKLRDYLCTQTQPECLLDLGPDVFDAAVDTNVLLVRNTKAKKPTFPAVSFRAKFNQHNDNIAQYLNDHAIDMQLPNKDEPWTIIDATEYNLKHKMIDVGTPLKEWNVSILTGIKTGLNDAFVIDDETRQALIAADPNSTTIIKPVLRGRDIQRYRAQWADLWLIDTHNGYGDVPAINVADYPAVKNHLDGFSPQLEKRQDKGRTPYNLRNCAYHEEFFKPKIIWTDIAKHMRGTYDNTGYFLTNTAYLLPTNDLAVLGFLGSTLFDWYSRQTFQSLGDPWRGGGLRYIAQYMENVPMFDSNQPQSRKIADLVARILSAKDADPAADTSELEEEIDQLCYTLYGLTDEEIAAVEGKA